MRQKIADTLKDFCVEYLHSIGLKITDVENGEERSVTEEDFKIHFPILKSEERSQVVREVIDMLREGILEDPAEARQLIDSNTVYDLPPLEIDEQLTDLPEDPFGDRQLRFETKKYEDYAKENKKDDS
jgi:hypothetical protein